MGFPRQEYWSALPFPSPGDLPEPGIKPESPVSSGRFHCVWMFTCMSWHPGRFQEETVCLACLVLSPWFLESCLVHMSGIYGTVIFNMAQTELSNIAWKKFLKFYIDLYHKFVSAIDWSKHQFSLVAQSCPTLCDPMDCSAPGLPVHHQLLEFTQTHVHWVGDAIQPSHPLSSPFPPALQSFPTSGSFQMSQFFTSCGQSIGVSASTSVLPMNTQDWSLLGWTGLISLQPKGLSRVFSNTTVQKHQFFSTQLSL